MKSKRLCFCAMMAALAAVLMLSAYFPYVTYAVPCVAALPVMVVVIELDKKSGLLTYLVSLLPVLLFSETEAKLLYLCFCGFYPVLKAALEKVKNRLLEYILKLLCFNAAVLVIYLLSTFVVGVSFDDLGELGKYGGLLFLALANGTFIAFDFCISKMAVFYLCRFHNTVQKMLR